MSIVGWSLVGILVLLVVGAGIAYFRAPPVDSTDEEGDQAQWEAEQNRIDPTREAQLKESSCRFALENSKLSEKTIRIMYGDELVTRIKREPRGI